MISPAPAAGVSTTYKRLPLDVSKGDRILLSDGLISLQVLSKTKDTVVCKVINGGELGQNKGINLPGVKLKIPALTTKDRADLAFALKSGANFIAVSFVRRAEDVLLAKSLVKKAGKDVPVIAKLEKPEAIENLDAILAVANGVMVARGDLGVEMSPEKVPVIQKMIIAKAMEARLPVITATQMLESMTQNPRPTRAEASDVANAVFDGSDALMLSGETAAGAYPVETVQMMDRIIREAEANNSRVLRPKPAQFNIAETAAELICHASEELDMKVIAVFTETGSTGRLISKHRPRPPIIAFSTIQETRRRLSLSWGVVPRTIAEVQEHRGTRPGRGETIARRALREARRRRGNRGGDAAIRRRHNQLHEISCHRQRRRGNQAAEEVSSTGFNLCGFGFAYGFDSTVAKEKPKAHRLKPVLPNSPSDRRSCRAVHSCGRACTLQTSSACAGVSNPDNRCEHGREKALCAGRGSRLAPRQGA